MANIKCKAIQNVIQYEHYWSNGDKPVKLQQSSMSFKKRSDVFNLHFYNSDTFKFQKTIPNTGITCRDSDRNINTTSIYFQEETFV